MAEPVTPARRWPRKLFAFALVYLFWLAVFLIIGAPQFWSAWYAYGAIPLAGALVTFGVLGFLYEVFAIDLPFVLDTLRFAIRKILPRRWATPLSAWLTRTWQKAPGWMRNASIWMPDDAPFEAPGQRPRQRSAKRGRND